MKTKKQLFQLFNALQTAKQKGDNAFKLKIIKNQNAIKADIEVLDELGKQYVETGKNQQKQISDLFAKYAIEKFNEKGEQQRQIPTDKLEAFNREYAKLMKNLKPEIDKNTKGLEDYERDVNKGLAENSETYTLLHVSSTDAVFSSEELEAFMEWGILDEVAQ